MSSISWVFNLSGAPILSWLRLDDIKVSSVSIVVIVVDNDNVVRLLGSEPIRCPLFRRGPFLGDGRDMYWLIYFLARVSFSGRA